MISNYRNTCCWAIRTRPVELTSSASRVFFLPTSLQGEGRYLNLQQIRILYAEDYDLVLFTVKQLLELEGWQVDICRNGSAAAKKIDSDEPYDLIILDVQMSGESGLMLVQRIRQLPDRRHLPVIMFSGSLRHEDALAAGANAFLNKPTGLKDLIATCKSLLNPEENRERDNGDMHKAIGNSYR